jgi:nucleoid-associated protein YgaU
MILFGYSPKTVQVLDAYTGQVQTYPLRTFLNSWKVLGHMAVIAGSQAYEETAASPDPDETGGEAASDSPRLFLPVVINVDFSQPEADEEESPEEQRTYIVRRGDYLLVLEQRFGVGWRALARVNGIEFPYVIHPGQLLKIP